MTDRYLSERAPEPKWFGLRQMSIYEEIKTVNARPKIVGPWSIAVIVVAMLWSSPALAQDDLEEEQEAAAEAALPEIDEEHPLYWAEMRDVYTMQQRPFLKEGRISATLYGGVIPNNIFQQYFPVGLRLSYYMMENIGVEVSTSYAFSRDASINEIIVDQDGIGAEERPLIGDSQLSHTTLGVKWSPVYGKFSFADSRLFYFDMYAFAGAGLAVVQTQTSFGDDPSTTAKPEGVVGAGMALYTSDNLGFQADYRQFIFQKVDPPGGVANPSEISLGATWFF